MSNIYLERLRSVSGKPTVQELPKLPKVEAIHGKPPVQELPKLPEAPFGSFGSERTPRIPENEAAPSLTDLDADIASRAAAAAAGLLARAAQPNRDAFALKNHGDAIKHFRRMALEMERLVDMYRDKVAGHIEVARKRLPPAEFDDWLRETEGQP